MTAEPAERTEGPPAPVTDPPYLWPPYRSSLRRAPRRPLLQIEPGATERTGPVLGGSEVRPSDADLTIGGAAAPIGERITVGGRLLDGDGRPVGNQLVELWQANAAGRYRHDLDRHPAPLDPNFAGAGRCRTDAEGHWRFVTIKPGAYPWGNHANAWRPAHLHLSVFGTAFTERLVTQMYFPGDPLMAHDPILLGVRDPRARERLVAELDWETTQESRAVGYRFDIVLTGHLMTPGQR